MVYIVTAAVTQRHLVSKKKGKKMEEAIKIQAAKDSKSMQNTGCRTETSV